MYLNLEFYTYSEVLSAVQDETVFAALISRDIASYLRDKMENLAMLYTIPRPAPILGLYFATLEEYYGDLDRADRMLGCYDSYINDIVNKPEQQYFKSINVSHITFFLENFFQNYCSVEEKQFVKHYFVLSVSESILKNAF